MTWDLLIFCNSIWPSNKGGCSDASADTRQTQRGSADRFTPPGVSKDDLNPGGAALLLRGQIPVRVLGQAGGRPSVSVSLPGPPCPSWAASLARHGADPSQRPSEPLHNWIRILPPPHHFEWAAWWVAMPAHALGPPCQASAPGLITSPAGMAPISWICCNHLRSSHSRRGQSECPSALQPRPMNPALPGHLVEDKFPLNNPLTTGLDEVKRLTRWGRLQAGALPPIWEQSNHVLSFKKTTTTQKQDTLYCCWPVT